jgi:hypothetical protein
MPARCRQAILDGLRIEEVAMPQFMLHHTHRPEQCREMFEAAVGWTSELKGKEFFCSCPGGEHGGFFITEAADAAAAVAQLPARHRETTRVYSGEVMTA